MDRKVLRRLSTSTPDAGLVLCSVIDFSGSVPRKDYPMMVVDPSGESLGTIGGGHLEYKVIEAAKGSNPDAFPTTLTFELTGSDLAEETGVCGGRLSVLLEKPDREQLNLFAEVEASLDTASEGFLELRYEPGKSRVSRRLVFHGAEQDVSREPASEVPEGFRVRVPLRSMPRLHVFGAGHVGAAVASLAVQLGIETMVYDDRRELLTEKRLPGARPRTLVPADAWEQPPYELGDYVVLASRSHRYDQQLLTRILKDAPNYIGVLASSRKWTLMHAALLSEGFPPDLLDRVNAPVGLPINSQTVPEIAVSILAQIVSHYRGGLLV